MKKYYTLIPFTTVLIKNSKEEILIGQIPDQPHKPFPLRWDLPGGKIEPFETPEECIKREVKEETGFDVEDLSLFKVFHYYGNDPSCTNKFPSLGLCYKVKVSGKLNPKKMDNMHWALVDEIKKLKLTPWTEYFLRDL